MQCKRETTLCGCDDCRFERENLLGASFVPLSLLSDSDSGSTMYYRSRSSSDRDDCSSCNSSNFDCDEVGEKQATHIAIPVAGFTLLSQANLRDGIASAVSNFLLSEEPWPRVPAEFDSGDQRRVHGAMSSAYLPPYCAVSAVRQGLAAGLAAAIAAIAAEPRKFRQGFQPAVRRMLAEDVGKFKGDWTWVQAEIDRILGTREPAAPHKPSWI